MIDKTLNSQGCRLLGFINDIRGFVTNGRITPKLDNFTSTASHKGNAVVDYIITRQSEINSVITAAVKPCYEIIDEKDLEQLIGPRSRVPDHNVVVAHFELSMIVREGWTDVNLGHKSVKRAKILRKVGDRYMNSETAKRLLPQLLHDIDEGIVDQQSVDKCYTATCDLMLSEAENSVEKSKQKRASTKTKPYWDLELAAKWHKMKECERLYQKHRKLMKGIGLSTKKK